MAGQLVGAEFRLPAELHRQINPAVLRRVEFEPGPEIRVVVQALVHFVDAGGDVGIRRGPHLDPRRPHGVGIGAVADIAAGQRLGIAAQRIRHESAIKWRAGEIVFHVHPADGEVECLVQQGFLRVGRHEMRHHVAAGAVDFLHRLKPVAE